MGVSTLTRRVPVALAAASLLWAAGPAGAGPAAAAAPPPKPAFSLAVSPTRMVLNGQQLARTQKFDVTNNGQHPLDVVVSLSDFVGDRAGMMTLTPNTPGAASNWLTVSPTRFHLVSGQRVHVSFRVKVQGKPEPGDHQVALLFSIPAATDGPNIRLSRAIGTPVYIAVPGAANANTHISVLRAPGFVMHGPVNFRATLVDTGSVHRDFRHPTPLKVRVAGRSVPFPDFTVLRNSTRDVALRWTNPPVMCICHATVTVPGPGGVSERTVRIIIFPFDAVGYGFGGLVVLLGLGLLGRWRYRAHIQAAAEKLSR